MSILGYENAEDMLKKTGKTPQECLETINAEIEKILLKRNEGKGNERHV